MTHPLAVVSHDAIVLAGGRGRRLGGISKPTVEVAGRQLLDHALDAAAGARRVVVAGPASLARPGIPTVLEDPPLGGPVAGLQAGLAHLDALAGPDDGAVVLVLACDVPLATVAVPRLLIALDAAPDSDGAVLAAADGFDQTLVAVYRREALRTALTRVVGPDGTVHGTSMKRLTEAMVLTRVPDPEDLAGDADTWEDVARLDARLRVPVRADTFVSSGSPGLDDWLAALATELGIDLGALDVPAVLDLSREVADAVGRPAVPATNVLIGYAVALAGGDAAARERVSATVSRLAAGWQR